MFGLFNKNIPNAKDKQFIYALGNIASDFQFGISAVEEEFADEIMHRALDIYLERNPEEAEYSATDFFLNSYVGAFNQATAEGNFSPSDSLALFSMTDNFLQGRPKYNTPLARLVMTNWQLILGRMGAIGA